MLFGLIDIICELFKNIPPTYAEKSLGSISSKILDYLYTLLEEHLS